jgi:uncharacterized protein (DUF1810 family)
MGDGGWLSCWIWYIFPQILIKKDGASSSHVEYAIHSIEEAAAYLENPVLGPRLLEITGLVLRHPDIPIDSIMGWHVDSMKLKSSMTLFSLVSPQGSVFHRVLDHFFEGERCQITLERMGAKYPVPDQQPSEMDPGPGEPVSLPEEIPDEVGYATDDPSIWAIDDTDTEFF